MFRGINTVNLDAKGRMAIPTRYRARLQDDASSRLIATIDTEEACLLLYPLYEWETIERKLENLPSFNKAARRIQRLLIGHATEIEMDNNGRVLLPQPLRDYAKLEKNMVLIGQVNKFEIWNDENWEKQRAGWLNESIETIGLPADLAELSL